VGTSTAWNGRTWALDCADCGQTGEVRRRPCPVKTARGLHYCPAAQLCGPCYSAERADGRWARAHEHCAAGARRSDREDAERAAHPDDWARSAVGDWADGVPAGMVRVITYAGSTVYVPKASYRSEVRGFGTIEASAAA
jgi:hypothetical protein